jgi:chromosome segregation ATPase
LKVNVKVTDLGPFKGVHEFTLDSERLNVIEAPNAAGKSSLIKGIAASLGLPTKRRVTSELARRLGLLPNTPEDRNPLVNTEAQRAKVELSIDGQRHKLEALPYGLPKVEPAGDERFLLTGLLLRESEIVRRLDEGSDDFSWLVSTLSLSSWYEVAKRVVEEHQIEARDILEQLQADRRSIDNYKQELEQLRAEREKLIQHRKELETQLVQIEDPRLAAELDDLRAKRNEKDRNVKRLQQTIAAHKAERERIEAVVKSHAVRLLELEADLKKITGQLDKLPTRREIEEAEAEASKLRRTTIPNLREEIGYWKSKVALLEQAVQHITKHAGIVPCPLCQECQANPIGLIQQVNFERALTNARDRQREAESKLAKAIQKAEDLESLRPEVNRKRKELQEKKSQLEAEFDHLKGKQIEAKAQLEPISQLLSSLEGELVREQTELNEINTRLQRLLTSGQFERRNQLVAALRQVEADLGRLDERIARLESEVERKIKVEVKGEVVQLASAISLYQEWVETLADLALQIEDAIQQQRKGAARSFNARVTPLLKEMGFEGLRVWIDESSYKLKVQRGNVDQPITSLSGSERHALAALLTLAAKEAYAPDIPFFLVDEVLLDFDRKRLTALSNYLKETSRNSGMLVVVSRLGGEKLNVKGAEEL